MSHKDEWDLLFDYYADTHLFFFSLCIAVSFLILLYVFVCSFTVFKLDYDWFLKTEIYFSHYYCAIKSLRALHLYRTTASR